MAEDPRIDPRIKAVFAALPEAAPAREVTGRDVLLAEEAGEAANARAAATDAMFAAMDTEDVAPSDGLTITTRSFVSAPDGNEIMLLFIPPDGGERLPCVYYIHGGGMQSMSCFNGM